MRSRSFSKWRTGCAGVAGPQPAVSRQARAFARTAAAWSMISGGASGSLAGAEAARYTSEATTGFQTVEVEGADWQQATQAERGTRQAPSAARARATLTSGRMRTHRPRRVQLGRETDSLPDSAEATDATARRLPLCYLVKQPARAARTRGQDRSWMINARACWLASRTSVP